MRRSKPPGKWGCFSCGSNAGALSPLAEPIFIELSNAVEGVFGRKCIQIKRGRAR